MEQGGGVEVVQNRMNTKQQKPARNPKNKNEEVGAMGCATGTVWEFMNPPPFLRRPSKTLKETPT